ncbi:MAG: response regulator [Bacteroidales bacterium]|nr:response regulator [Bacteroidales bacterium]MDP2236451.1 response regulator [Bacteroidales bacterium]
MSIEKQTLRLLLVEDNELNQKFAMAVLRKMGHTVEIAANGLIGVEKFKEKPFDMILMDIQMPEMNGIEATRAIRQLEELEGQGKHITIIAVTAFAMDQDKKNCMDAGMDDFLAKPYKPFELEDKINNNIK